MNAKPKKLRMEIYLFFALLCSVLRADATTNPVAPLLDYLRTKGVEESALPLTDPIWKQTVEYLREHQISITFQKLPLGLQAEFQRTFEKDPSTGQELISEKGELIRGGYINLNPSAIADPRQLLSLLVHETTHARRWINSGDRKWSFKSKDGSLKFEDFEKNNRLNIAGDEALAHLHAAKFAIRNSIPMTDTEKALVAITKKTQPLSVTVRELREFLEKSPEYQNQHKETLSFIFNSGQEVQTTLQKKDPTSLGALTSADLFSFKTLEAMGNLSSRRGCEAILKKIK